MSNRDSNGDADGGDAQRPPIHVTAVLVASVRAMSNALAALGFPEEDNRIVEQDGGFGFVTCSHEQDCDDMFALIAELSSSNETWEIHGDKRLPTFRRRRRSRRQYLFGLDDEGQTFYGSDAHLAPDSQGLTPLAVR